MKKLLFTLLAFSIILASCTPDDPDVNYHVSFTVNGTSKTYTGHVLAHLDTAQGYITLTIIGAHNPTSFDDNMGIYLNNFPGGGAISAGIHNDNATDKTLLTTYVNNNISYEAGQSIAQDAVNYGVTIPNHFKLTITSMGSQTIKGTFSGTYYEDGDVQTGTPLEISNGSFFVKFQ